MERTDNEYASETINHLREKFRLEVHADWGVDPDGSWQVGNWLKEELDRLEQTVSLLAEAMGGDDRFIRSLNRLTIQKADIGSHGGEALRHRVSLSKRGTFTGWTVVHELAHAWDANHGWGLSVELERYTGGYTSRVRSFFRKVFGPRDSGFSKSEDLPGRRGRLPGCNAAGYFYGDKPSGSNWAFNRKEDFAESVAMYIGWGKRNELSAWAEGRIHRYLLPNGANAKNFGVDNWSDYKPYFYPEDGDYSKTLRWKFVDELMKREYLAV